MVAWIALCVVVLVLAALTAFVSDRLLETSESQRVEIQKLTAALISKENAVPAAVYMSHDPSPEKPNEQILEERAEKKASWKPLGM